MFSMQTHQYRADKNGHLHIEKENHYIRFSAQNQAPVYLQGGRAYYEDGSTISSLPAWVVEQLPHCNPRQLALVGWTAEGKTLASKSATPDLTVESETPASSTDDPREMKFFALRAWAKREHEIVGATREEIIEALEAKGVI